MKIIKRNGSEAEFDKAKIGAAITKANNAIPEQARISPFLITAIQEEIAEEAASVYYTLNVEEIQDMVEKKLMDYHAIPLATAYIRYREKRAMARQANSTDERILSLIDCDNEEVKQENSNKKPSVVSVQRDYMAGEVSRDLTRRILLPQDIVDAHEKGIIHFHDADYFAQHMFNCFTGDTELVTNMGVKKFNSFRDGQVIEVVDKHGKWRKATVHRYGFQRMQTVTFQSGRSVKKIRCTKNHRWFLRDGTETTSLKVGDRLALLPEMEQTEINNDMFCLGFVLADGSDYFQSESNKGVRIRLCGKKTRYLQNFMDAGYAKAGSFKNGDLILCKAGDNFKKEFIKSHSWRFLSRKDQASLFLGYYAADGAVSYNRLSTADENILQMIKDISSSAGYYISSVDTAIRNTNYKNGAILHNIRFRKYQNPNNGWIIKKLIHMTDMIILPGVLKNQLLTHLLLHLAL